MRSTAAIFGAPVTDPPGNVAPSSSASPTSSRSVPSTVETRCSTPASRARHQLGPADGPGLADPREVVPLEVDDHHVLGRVLLRLAQLRPLPERPRALDRHVHTRRPRRARKSSGEAVTIAHPSPPNGSRGVDASGPRAAPARRIARERRSKVLDEVDLVDVARRSRHARPRRRSRTPPRPGPLPLADPESPCSASAGSGSERTARDQRQRGARLGRRGASSGGSLREPVAEVEIGAESSPPGSKNPRVEQPGLEALERAVGVAELEHRLRHVPRSSRRRGRPAPCRRRPGSSLQKIALPATSRSAPASRGAADRGLLMPPSPGLARRPEAARGVARCARAPRA